MSILTREDIVGLQDITWKPITVPDNIPAWGGKQVYIRQLTRGQQDEYLKLQFGGVKLKQDGKGKSQEFGSISSIYGHDVWICVQGMCDENGIPLFTKSDEKVLAGKSGEAIGWIATQIIEFSGMKQEADEAAALETLETETKN
jgi:hypothetical protein